MDKFGKLYLVATPLGNLEDITFRALRILAEVDLIAAEDTRRTLKLLNHFQIKKKLVSYYRQNERERSGYLVETLQQGMNIALVSDAGMPGISDPGTYLVQEAIKQGIIVIPIPGPSAVITALAASGLETSSFWFEGFLPRKEKEQLAKFESLAGLKGTLIFYEAPHRLRNTLRNALQILGDRLTVLARELTKIHEELIRGSLSEVLAKLEVREPKGEFTVLIEGAKVDRQLENRSVEDLAGYLAGIKGDSLTLRTELRAIARQTGKTTKEIYQLYLSNRTDRSQ